MTLYCSYYYSNINVAELPDTGSSGFILPASQIQRVGRETKKAVLAMINDLTTNRG